MNSFLFALQQLTRIHIKDVPFEPRDLGRSPLYFPLVGLIIGVLAAAFYAAADSIFPSAVVASLLVVGLVMLTGGIHLDGFMDTVDGVFSGRPRERKLEIMRDSRVGAFGALGVACLLLIKFTLIYELPSGCVPGILLVMPVISRWAMVYAIARFPYAREEGMGRLHSEYTGTKELIIVSAVTLLISVAAAGPAGLLLLIAAWGFTEILCRYFIVHLGGLTGDTYGAVNETCEVFVLLGLYPVYSLMPALFGW